MRTVLSLSLFVIILSVLAGPVFADERKYWDFGIGPGLNLDGNGTAQILLCPAYNGISGSGHLWYRLEGNFELIDKDRQITAVIGLSPLVRYYLRVNMPNPLFEIGAGANVITRNHTGNKDSGGAFIFSPSLGAGIKFGSTDRPVTVSLRFRHLSNAHIYEINQSMNALYLLFAIGL